MSKEKQCCGNCGWSQATPKTSFVKCTFKLPDSAERHAIYMFANEQGKTCPCWKPKEEE